MSEKKKEDKSNQLVSRITAVESFAKFLVEQEGETTLERKDVIELLIDNFDRMNMETPSNFDEIADFVYKYIIKADGSEFKEFFHIEDLVVFGFRKWMESKAKQQ